MHVHIEYCTNFNGVNITIDSKPIEYGDNNVGDSLIDALTDWSQAHCNMDGVWHGNFEDLINNYTALCCIHLNDPNVIVNVTRNDIDS